MQIYCSQTPEYINLMPKAYVPSTYNGPLFKSDVSRGFWSLLCKKGCLWVLRSGVNKGRGQRVLDK
ncbi:MAG: hypothetical protein D3903_19400 [Candidatus Electrothrix sp. GM3_4]|nr:hypothetical protein [Candidatus Electrothrix sp. GM3_4]